MNSGENSNRALRVFFYNILKKTIRLMLFDIMLYVTFRILLINYLPNRSRTAHSREIKITSMNRNKKCYERHSI